MPAPTAGPGTAWLVAVSISLALAPAQLRAQRAVSGGATGGSLLVIITDKAGGLPLAFADVKVESARTAAFADDRGHFLFSNIPAGATTVRARRLGFLPSTVPATVVAGRTDTVRVPLTALTLQLTQVRVSDNLCPNRASRAGDTAVVSILQQLQLNAERLRLLADEYPYTSSMERLISNEAPYGDRPLVGQRRTRVDTVRVDTVDVASRTDWRYRPGQLIVPHDDRQLKVRDKLIVPTLVDFADDAFVSAHCFRYAGLELADSVRAIRIDFEPTRAVRDPDVRGSLWLDAATFQILRSTLLMERPSPFKADDLWDVRVDTWFRLIRPSLPVIDRIAERTSMHPSPTGRGENAMVSMEQQRLIGFVFNGNRP